MGHIVSDWKNVISKYVQPKLELFNKVLKGQPVYEQDLFNINPTPLTSYDVFVGLTDLSKFAIHWLFPNEDKCILKLNQLKLVINGLDGSNSFTTQNYSIQT